MPKAKRRLMAAAPGSAKACYGATVNRTTQEGRDKGGQWKKEMPYSVIKQHKSQFELDLSEWESDCDSGHCGL